MRSFKKPLKARFGLDDVHVAYPWTIYLVTYMLGQFFAAWLGRRMRDGFRKSSPGGARRGYH
jgi:hypothetical protein